MVVRLNGRRTARNIIQNGRVLFPMDDDIYQKSWAFWRATPLLKQACVSGGPLPELDGLVEIEDPRSDAIPSFTGQRHAPSKGERVFQIGPQRASKLIQAVTTDLSSCKCLLLLESVCSVPSRLSNARQYHALSD